MTGQAGLPSGGAVGDITGLSAEAVHEAWESSPALVAVTLGADHVLVYQNAAARAMFGGRPLGLPLREAFPELTEAGLAPMGRVLATGRPVEMPPGEVGVRDLLGDLVVLHYVLAPLGPAGQPPAGVVITAIDVTAEVRAERAVARARLLAELSARVTAAGDATSGLQALTDALVPQLADVAAVYVVGAVRSGPDSRPIPPEVLTIAEALAPLGPPPPPSARTGRSPWEDSLRAGEALILPVHAGSMPVVAPDPASAAWLTGARAHSIAVVPLVVAGEMTGALVLLGVGERTPYGDEDLPFLVDIAARTAAAVGQVSTQQRQRDVALRLQSALLPAAPPELPGVAVAARYIAGAPGVEVGGDWWDVQDLGQGRIAVGIGDVSGRGVSAAAVMGQARAAMHAAGRAGLPPAEVMRLLDAQVHEVTTSGRLDEPASPRFATACYAVLDRATCRLLASNAGHLPLLVRAAGGGVRRVELPAAAPLGLLVGRFTETSVALEAGDTVVLFTDGLVEIHDRDLDEGIDVLAGELDRTGGRESLDEVADGLLAAMGRRPGYGHDDVALLILRPDG